ncbi:MAG TPA: DedA family protein [Acidimicrobiales bacterium]|nr:DedA family protein [Acidimicrobiales bacterium]
MTHLLLTWGYLALFIAVLLAAMGIPTGSELVIAFAGALASGKVSGSEHHLNIVVVIVVASIAELAGSFLGYGIGRVGGRPLVEHLGKYVLITPRDLDRAERLFQRHGQPVVFFGRFIPLVRSFVGIAAGIAEMAVLPFAVFTGLAATLWVAAFALLGDSLGAKWNHSLHSVSTVGYAVAALVVVLGAALFLKRFREVRHAHRGLRQVQGEAAPREGLVPLSQLPAEPVAGGGLPTTEG